MTPAIAKIALVALAVGWYLIRYEYARRSRRAPDVFRLLALGCRPGALAAKLGGGFCRACRFRDSVLRTNRRRITNDAGCLWQPLSRLYGAHLPGHSVDILDVGGIHSY